MNLKAAQDAREWEDVLQKDAELLNLWLSECKFGWVNSILDRRGKYWQLKIIRGQVAIFFNDAAIKSFP